MVRTQIQLKETQYRSLYRWSQRLGISLSEAIRRWVAERLAREDQAPSYEERVRQALALVAGVRTPTQLRGPASLGMVGGT